MRRQWQNTPRCICLLRRKEDKMEYVILSNGVKMPILGYGVYQVTKDRLNAFTETRWMLLVAAFLESPCFAVVVGRSSLLQGISRKGIEKM